MFIWDRITVKVGKGSWRSSPPFAYYIINDDRKIAVSNTRRGRQFFLTDKWLFATNWSRECSRGSNNWLVLKCAVRCLLHVHSHYDGLCISISSYIDIKICVFNFKLFYDTSCIYTNKHTPSLSYTFSSWLGLIKLQL